MTTLAIDPGTTDSAWVLLDGWGGPISWALTPNALLLHLARTGQMRADHVVVEMVESYGMRFVGEETYLTCVMVGRIVEALRGADPVLLHRSDVKLHLLGARRGKDPDVRAALLDLYGGKQAAIGTKSAPGPLHGVKRDIWSALAVGRTFLAQPACRCREGST